MAPVLMKIRLSRPLLILSMLALGISRLPAQTTGPVETPAKAAPAPADGAAAPGPPSLPDLQSAPAQPESPHQSWFANYQAARQKAVAENKHLLIVFTGAGWIPLCRIYDRDLLNQAEFVDAVSEQFVLVRLDYPKDFAQSRALPSQHQLLMRAYRVSAFPTLLLTDTDGRPYGINGYQPVTPANYAKVIGAMRQIAVLRDQYFGKAASATGVEKATLLAKGVPNLPGNLAARYYRPEIEGIIASDPRDETGKVAKCRRLIADVDYADRMADLEKQVEWGKMLDLTDAYIRDNALQGRERQQALMNKTGVYRHQGKIADMVRTLLEIVSIDEKSPQARQAQSLLDQLRAQKLQEELSPRK